MCAPLTFRRVRMLVFPAMLREGTVCYDLSSPLRVRRAPMGPSAFDRQNGERKKTPSFYIVDPTRSCGTAIKLKSQRSRVPLQGKGPYITQPTGHQKPRGLQVRTVH